MSSKSQYKARYKGAYLAGWWRRVLAHFIDVWSLPALILFIGILSVPTSPYSEVASGLTFYFLTLLLLCWMPFVLLNQVLLHGLSGRSIGKYLLGMRLVDAESGYPPGVTKAFVRLLAHNIDGMLIIGWFFPLWHGKRQTFADQICVTVTVMDPHRLPSDKTSWRKKAKPASEQFIDIDRYTTEPQPV